MTVFRGVKYLEFGSGAAGPVAARYFAERGARVIRIESSLRPDFLRLLALTPGSEHGLDDAPMFVLLNPNKESVAVDLTKAEGVALVRRLARWADVVCENFSPGVMHKLGLDYASLAGESPGLIMMSCSLYGQTGPQRSYPGFGGQSSAIAGFNHLTGWPDREALGPFGTIVDSLAPRYVALLIAGALFERRRTGRGAFIDLSQIEAAVYTLSEMIVRHSGNGEIVTRAGNRDEVAAPHGVYRCRSIDGEERFIAIAVWSDDEWMALKTAMDRPSWADAIELDHIDGRRARQDDIDAQIGAWTRARDAFDLMAQLQAAGVEAGVVQNEADLLRDPQLKHRAHFRLLPHRHLGPLHFEHAAICLSDAPRTIDRPAPDLGEHTRAVLQEVLGLTPEEVRRLEDDKVLV